MLIGNQRVGGDGCQAEVFYFVGSVVQGEGT